MKKINLSFYKSLLYCDFFLVKKNFYQTNANAVYFLKRFKSYSTLDLLETIKNFKTFINVLKFVSEFSFKQNKIFLNIEDEWHFSLLNTFFKFSNLNQKAIFCINKDLHREHLPMTSERFLFCSLGPHSLKRHENIEKIFKKKLYLISQFKLNFNNSIDGGYNLQTDFFDFKKLIFLIILIYKSCVMLKKSR